VFFGGGSTQFPDTVANGRPSRAAAAPGYHAELDELRRDGGGTLGVRLPCDARAPGAGRIVVTRSLRERRGQRA
jgi:hypothetical protein